MAKETVMKNFPTMAAATTKCARLLGMSVTQRSRVPDKAREVA